MATEFNTGNDTSLNEAVKSRYEANSDTNAYTDSEKTKLAGITTGAEPNAVDSVNGQFGAVVLDADDINDGATNNKFASAAQLSKLDGVEVGATGDQTGAEIVSAIDAELGGSSWQSGSSGGAGTVDVVSNVRSNRLLGRLSSNSGDSEELNASLVRSFLNVEDGATGDQTGAEIVSAIDAELGGSTWQSGGGTGGGAVNVVSDVASGRILGRLAAGSGDSEELTAADLRAFLDALSTAILASNANGEGAALVGIEDAGSFTTRATVEGALQEIYEILDNHGDIVTQDIATFVRKSEREVIVFDAGGDYQAARPTQASDKTVIWFNHGGQLPANMGTFDIAKGQEVGVATVNLQTGAVYTLAIGDEGANIDMDAAGANVVTIPAEASVAFPVGTCMSVTQLGAGETRVTAESGVTLNGVADGSVSINNRYSGVVVRKTAADVWIAQGDIS